MRIMRKYGLRKFICILLTSVMTVLAPFGNYMSVTAVAETGTVNTDRLNMRSGPGTNYSVVKVLSTNTAVNINSSCTGSDGRTWYSVTVGNTNGYLRSDFVNKNVTYSANDLDFESYLSAQGFPESYKNSLRGLHQKYPNWVFTAMHTGLDWNEVVREESKIGRNLVADTSISSFKSTEQGGFDWAANYWPGYDGATWVAASEGIIKHYLDPRNFLTDPYIFQFELQTYNPSMQTREGLMQLVKGTFLEGSAGTSLGGAANGPGGTMSGSTYGPGGSTAGGTSYGPGSSTGSGSGSGTSTAGPGSSTSGTGSSNGPGGSSSGGSVSVSDVPGGVIAKINFSLFKLFGGISSYAAWETNLEGKWVYKDTDGTYKKNGWYWLDGNNDGIAESYYFDSNGIMAADTVIDGYTVNSEGQWTDNGKVQTKVVGFNSGTGSEVSYVDLIMKAAEQSGVSPYVLAAMIIQEQGVNGTSELISGKNRQYYGYYNFYNIAAYEHDGMTAVQAGLKYASEYGNGNRPWNTVEKGIVGGAIAYGANYTNDGQDTFYLKKFNVQGSNKYNHQFMSNVIAAAQEGAKVANAYTQDIKNGRIEFKIPVYKNMPETPCELPTGTGNPNYKLASLTVDGHALTPSFSMDTLEYSLIVDGSVSGINIYAQAIDSKARVEGAGGVALGVGQNDITIRVTAENGTSRDYKLKVTRRAENSENAPAFNATSTGPGAQTGTGNMTGPGSMMGPGAQTQQPAESQTQQAQPQNNQNQNNTTDTGGSSQVSIGKGPGE
ncbi:MAG: cadherin-like beta sandwich domain-containing protein [Eubacteriales bacterium]|nr:cadherin-like beta sandwich domain-containing protein [Eubacteriales bacterium]